MVQTNSLSFNYGERNTKFASKEEERQHVKERLALGFRVLSRQDCGECGAARRPHLAYSKSMVRRATARAAIRLIRHASG